MMSGWRKTLVCVAACWATASAATAAPPSACGFVGDSLVPQLAMGVRQLDGEDIDQLRVHDDPGGKPLATLLPLFRPYFVVETRTDSAGAEWHLLQDGYTAESPLGWARGAHVHLFQSRYAYTFARRKRERLADLHDDSKESYERLLAQVNGDIRGAEKTVVVNEREGAETWEPVTIDDVVPFVELRISPEKRDREHPDTTPTFRFGVPIENRLVHMGAVCGGPVDRELLEKRREMAAEEKGLEMVFVIDDTVSMAPFSQIVAKFIRDAGEVAESRPTPVKMAVCSYRDGPADTTDEGELRVTLGDLHDVKEASDVESLADDVEKLGHFLPPGEYANPPERMLEGLRDCLANLEFERGATLFVTVLGDTGHEPEDPAKPALVADIARKIEDTGASVFFMHVGRRSTSDEMLFKEDSVAVAEAVKRLGGKDGLVAYKEAGTNNLKETLRAATEATELRRMQLRRVVERMESRTPYTAPGSKLLEAMKKRGLDRAAYDDRYLQYFVPSRGWLFHPTSKDTGLAQPQFRELFLLAEPEQEAVGRMFDDLRDKFARGEQIDGNAVIAALADDLESASKHRLIGDRMRAAWNRMPAESRSVGVFLEDLFGLRLKAALPFPSVAYEKDRPAAAREIGRLSERVDGLSRALKSRGGAAFWFDASSLVP
jgi:hypothetical protein